MGRERSSGRWRELGEPPSEVRITVFPHPDGLGLRERVLARYGIRFLMRASGLSVVVVVVAALTAIVVFGGGSGARQGVNPRAREPGAMGVAAAYGYASRCVSITISAIDRGFARADFDHARECGDYTGYVTAIFHRSNHEWQPVLEAVSYLCPVARIPRAVERELGVCP